jgi:hypothetical protein
MNFDFYQLYTDYSNTELLKIIKQPTAYQPAAVAVAKQILSERQVTTEEIEFVEQHFHDIDNTTKAKKEKSGAIKNKVTDFFEPVLHPRESVEPSKWVNILLFIIAIQYAWSFFGTVKSLIGFLKCSYCSIDIIFFTGFLTLFYVPVIFFLLFKRRRWGWILLFADNLFSLISRASESWLFFKYQSIHQGDVSSFLLPILIKAAFVSFLWREPIADHFGITKETKTKTALITAVATLLFILGLYLVLQ